MLTTTAMLVGAVSSVAATTAIRRTREHQSLPARLGDLLNWGFMVSDGVILQKDGALLAGWHYRGPDLTAITNETLTALSAHVNDALVPLGDGWVLHVDAIRRPAVAYAASRFPTPVATVIDLERREAYASWGRQFETTYVLTLTYLPPADRLDRAARWFVTGPTPEHRAADGRGPGTTAMWDGHLATFERACTAFEARVGGHLHVERLTADPLLTHLHTCLTGLAHRVHTPPVARMAYLDAILGDHPFVGGFTPQVGAHHVRIVAVEGYPDVSSPGMLDALNRLPYAYRWSHRIITLSAKTADAMIRRHQLTWFKKRKGAGAWLKEIAAKDTTPVNAREEALFRDQNAEAMAEDAAAARAENTSGTVRYCVYNQMAVVTDPDPHHADIVASAIVKVLHDHGLTARVETLNAVEAFLGTLPGHGSPNVRRPLLSSANIADLLPLTSVWPGPAHNPCPYYPPKSPPLFWAKAAGATPFRVTLHAGDVGHTLIVGPTGAGKSTLIGLIAAQFQRYPDAQLFLFDVGYSGWMLAQACGAAHYDIASGAVDTLTVQPLAQVDHPAERAWAVEWIETLVTLQGMRVTTRQRERIDRALVLVSQAPATHRTLSELQVHLQDPELVAALRPYTATGAYGRLLDANADMIGGAHDDTTDPLEAHPSAWYQVFELKHLMALDDKVLVPVLLYLFHRIEQRLTGRPTLIVIEELWAPLMRSVFADRIKQWLLTLRKQNAAVVLVAHSLAQFETVPNAAAILDSCPTRIFLANAQATSSRSAPLYRDIGLQDREIEHIARGRPKRDYYLISPSGSRQFELDLGPVARAFVGTPDGMTADEARHRAQRLREHEGARWPSVWLAEHGMTVWGDRLDRLFDRPIPPLLTPAGE